MNLPSDSINETTLLLLVFLADERLGDSDKFNYLIDNVLKNLVQINQSFISH